jgi:formamidase
MSDIGVAARTLTRTMTSIGWDRTHPPALCVNSGDVVLVHAPECSNGQISETSTLDDFLAMDLEQLDPIGGPIYVEEAEPGDVLRVEILQLDPGPFGWSANYPGTGLLTEDYPDPWFYVWDLTTGSSARYLDDIWVPLEPMVGVIGCTPAAVGPFPSVPPMRTGGNLDTKYIREGTTVLLPVEVPGALLGIGDPHAAQGDGEVGGAGIETPMDITVRITVDKGRSIPFPQLEIPRGIERRSATAGYHVTTGVAEDLRRAAQEAVRGMIGWLESTTALRGVEALELCSVAADLKISEVVNDPMYVVSAFLPLDLFARRPRQL